MSLCRLLVLDFTRGTGRVDDEDGCERYDDYDLQVALDYAEALLDEGYFADPIDGFCLEDLAQWCIAKGARSR